MIKRVKISLFLAGIIVFTLMSVCKNSEAQKTKKMRDRIEYLEEQFEKLSDDLKTIIDLKDPESFAKKQEKIIEKLDWAKRELLKLKEIAIKQVDIEEEQDERLDEISDEVELLWGEYTAQKKDIERMKKNKTSGYEKGFFLGTRDGKFGLIINGFMKPYYQFKFAKVYDTDSYGSILHNESGDPTGGDAKILNNDFGLSSMRIGVSAKLFDVLTIKLNIDYGVLYGKTVFPNNANIASDTRYNKVTINSYALQALDAWGEYALHEAFKLRAGQFKVPFDREGLTETNGLTFTSRSLMTKKYLRYGEYGLPDNALIMGYGYEIQNAGSVGYDRGFMVSGGIANELFNYSIGFFNGAGSNIANDNRDMLFATRITVDFPEKMTPGMSDLETSAKPHFSIGSAFVWNLNEHNSPYNPSDIYNSQDTSVSSDLHFKWHGVSLMSSLFFRYADHGAVYQDSTGHHVPISSLGIMAQAAYYNETTGLEPGFRYSMYDADVGRVLDHAHEFTGVLNYYFSNNDLSENYLKLQLEYCGVFAAKKDQSYFVPWGAWFEPKHEMTLMVQFGF